MKAAFSQFLGADPRRLHFAAHSHHPWPDITLAAHQQAWLDAARLMDDKWEHLFATVLPSARRRVASVLGLEDPDSLAFAPNTHEFVVRIASTLPTPFRVLTTDSEFHSFSRQLSRWEEAGVATATRVPARPYATFLERFVDALDGHDLVFLSQVHFNSGYLVADLDALVDAIGLGPDVVIDGYHGFMAVPTDLSGIASRAYYLAGGYKYAMAGEGACFLHVPPDAPARPVDTGWFAGFSGLASAQQGVPYAAGGMRFAGATFDPSGVYRLDSVLAWLEDVGVSVSDIHNHVAALQQRLLEGVDERLRSRLLPGPAEVTDRGHFLTFRRDDAADLYHRLKAEGIVTDHRADRWRVGLGIYHDADDVDRLCQALDRLA